MRWNRAGLMQPTSILDAATLQLSVIPVCACGHRARFEAHCLWWHFHRQGWDDQFDRAVSRFWCRICASGKKRKVRPDKIEHAAWEEGDFELPWPDEREWKKAMSRLR